MMDLLKAWTLALALVFVVANGGRAAEMLPREPGIETTIQSQIDVQMNLAGIAVDLDVVCPQWQNIITPVQRIGPGQTVAVAITVAIPCSAESQYGISCK